MVSNILRSRVPSRVLLLLTALCAAGTSAWGQTCLTSGTPLPVHAEGLAERVGDLGVTCTGGTAGATVSLTMFVSLNVAITNRLDTNGDVTGITFTGATVGALRLTSPTTISLSGVNYTVPAVPAVPVNLTLSGIRANISSVGVNTPVYASVIGVGATFNSGAQVSLATAFPSLLTSYLSNGIPCAGSPLPTTLDFASFAAASTASTIRVTEASAAAFLPKATGDDSGTRLIVKLTGYGTGTRVFVPDGIVGNTGTTPTTAGAFTTPITAGTYTPGANQLLLARVSGSDANGAAGNIAFSVPSAVTAFTTMTEVTLVNGAATVIYEVLDGNRGIQESAHIPVFVVAPATSCASSLSPIISATMGPVSTAQTATQADPIPRFLLTTPGLDCSVLGDCNSPFYPKLSVDQTPVSLTGTSLGDTRSATVRVGNSGSGVLAFTTSVSYGSGSSWLTVSPPSGSNNVSLQLIADPSKLTQGTYTATVTVSAGQYGTGTIPVTFTVGPVGLVIQNVGNAASYQYGTVAPGSYAVLFGLNLGGKNVTVTFNGLPATIVYASATQINLIVPVALGGQQGASVIVTADGQASNAFKVNLALNAPGVFDPGIVNFTDGKVNTVTTPASRGDIVLVFLTGLATPASGVTVNIGGVNSLVPAYAGAQGTFPGLNQVNIAIPSSLGSTPNPVPLQVCVPGTVGQQICSNSVNLYIR